MHQPADIPGDVPARRGVKHRLPTTARRETNSMKVRMQTSYGAVIIELDPHKAPKTVNNFIAYVRDGYYGRYAVSPHHRRLHGPGRRLPCRA